jgi:KAP-like P-loop domain-containing protein
MFRQFTLKQFRRISIGIVLGSIVALFVHLLIRDPLFVPSIRTKWRSLPVANEFEGFRAYTPEFYAAFIGFLMLAVVPCVLYVWRFVRSWWAGITSVTTFISATVTFAVLLYGTRHPTISATATIFVLVACIGGEAWRQESRPVDQICNNVTIDIPKTIGDPKKSGKWHFLTSDDPIDDWKQDIIGRAAVVELLAEHTFRDRTPVIALNGDYGDGKTSVLRLFQKAIENKAIVVSFSAWLPGTETTLASFVHRHCN